MLSDEQLRTIYTAAFNAGSREVQTALIEALRTVEATVRADQIEKDAGIVCRLESDSPHGGMVQYAPIVAAIRAQLPAYSISASIVAQQPLIPDSERRAPVQGGFEGNLRRPAGTISWSEHLEAWEVYDRKYHTRQSAERIAERGGFGHSELKMFLGRPPTTFLSDTVGGPWTSHGHEISGITLAGPGRPPVARCGGPSLCNRCSREAEGVRWSHAGRPE